MYDRAQAADDHLTSNGKRPKFVDRLEGEVWRDDNPDSEDFKRRKERAAALVMANKARR